MHAPGARQTSQLLVKVEDASAVVVGNVRERDLREGLHNLRLEGAGTAVVSQVALHLQSHTSTSVASHPFRQTINNARTWANTISQGFSSGEYLGRKNMRMPHRSRTAPRAPSMSAATCTGALSSTCDHRCALSAQEAQTDAKSHRVARSPTRRQERGGRE